MWNNSLTRDQVQTATEFFRCGLSGCGSWPMKAEIWKPFQSANIGKKTLSVDPNMHGWWEWIPRKSRNHESSEIWSHCPGAFSVGKVSFYIHRCPNWTYTCVWMDILYTEPCSSSGSSSNGEYPFSTVARSLLSKHMDSLQLQKALQQNHQIFMESPLVHGSSYMGLIFIIVIVLFRPCTRTSHKIRPIFCTEKVWAVASARETRSHTKAVGPRTPIWRKNCCEHGCRYWPSWTRS